MNILLLHGALSSSLEFSDWVEKLSAQHVCHVVDFAGHGSDAGTIDLHRMATELAEEIQEVYADNPYHILGYSMGGYVAMYAAAKSLISPNSICALATKINWNPAVLEMQNKALNYDKLLENAPSYIQGLTTIFTGKTPQQAIAETLTFMEDLTENNYLNAAALNKIHCKVLLMRGNRDHFVLEEDVAFAAQHLPESRIHILEDTPHFLFKMNQDFVIHEYLKNIEEMMEINE